AQRMAPAPVQEVAVEVVGPQAPQARLARRDGPGEARVLGQHLADDEQLLAAAARAGHRLRDQLLGAAVAVHLGGVDVHEIELEAGAQRLDLLTPARGAAHLPGPLPDDRDRDAVRAEGPPPDGDRLAHDASIANAGRAAIAPGRRRPRLV